MSNDIIYNFFTFWMSNLAKREGKKFEKERETELWGKKKNDQNWQLDNKTIADEGDGLKPKKQKTPR